MVLTNESDDKKTIVADKDDDDVSSSLIMVMVMEVSVISVKNEDGAGSRDNIDSRNLR